MLNHSNYKWVCPVEPSINDSHTTGIKCNDPLEGLSTLTFDFSLSQDQLNERQIHTNGHCIFEPNVCGLASNMSSHLKSCEEYSCNETYFKCPGYYCLPWRFVCNGQWDCPGGRDEHWIVCNQTSCPGMYRCKSSRVCVSHNELCDTVSDCPMKDDEHFCLEGRTKLLCPSNTLPRLGTPKSVQGDADLFARVVW